MRVRAFLDANIITSKTLRDWLFKLSLEDAETLTLISSEKVLAEARRAFQKRNPTAGPEAVAGLFDRIRSVLSHVVDDSDVVSMEIEESVDTIFTFIMRRSAQRLPTSSL